MYTGQLVRLREYRKEDVPIAQTYINDPEIKRYINPGIPLPFTLEDEERWYQGISGVKAEGYSFAIECLQNGKYIGGCGINQIDWKNSTAVVGIFIGEEEYRSRGYGTDAMKVLISFIFEQMNINKVKLYVLAFNQRAIKSYEKCGFQVDGVLRQEVYRDGRYHDDVIMSILREEYFGSKASEVR